MELRQLRYFVAIAEERSLTRAAQRLVLSQPSLSQQLARLERELGVRLVHRSTRPVQLTEAGTRLLADAQLILGHVEDTTRRLRRTAENGGELRIGFVHGGLFSMFLPMLRAFRQTCPHARLSVHQLNAADQQRAVQQGRVDLSLARITEPMGPDVVVRPVEQEHLIALLPDSHPLAAPGIAPADLASTDEPPPTATNYRRTSPPTPVELQGLSDDLFVAMPRRLEPWIYDRCLVACMTAGFSPRIEHEVLDAQSQALLVAVGAGVALSGSGLALRFPGVRYVPVQPRTNLADIAILHRPDVVNELVHPFIEAALRARRPAAPEETGGSARTSAGSM